MSRRGKPQAGFSLVEMMLGLLLTTLVSLALAGASVVGYRAFTTETRQIAAGKAVSGATLTLVRDLSSATTFTTGTITRNTGTLQVTYGVPPATVVVYRIDAANNLTRTIGGSTSVAARGMQSVTIARAVNPVCAITVTMRPSAVGAAAVTLRVSQRVGTRGCF
ncbi:MAG TPA: prepilin-type N-terminal cleavage/methylation domain-containing protein [Candidatus Dormibacteraeota bacterium]|nr:prepilin-type N-terminal cleavage/methylation domain-containing protein [Candidatus Dormibacteraeota bacterium]